MNEENRNLFENEETPVANDNPTPVENPENETLQENDVPEVSYPEDTPSAEQEEVPTVEAEPVQPNNNQGKIPTYGVPHPTYNPGQSAYNTNRTPYSNTPYTQGTYRPAPAQVVAPPEKKKSFRGLKIFDAIVSVLLVFSILFSGALVLKYINGPSVNNNPSETVQPSTTESNPDSPDLNIASTPAAVDGALTTADIAEKVKPSIVGIVCYTNSSGSSAGEGTGVIMGENDAHTETYIVTCAHVISDPGIKVKVQTEDGTTYDATIVGFDSRTDLGVVKIKATGLPAAEFGNSDNLRVGDSVFAIGNPGGVEFFGSFTGGYVSAINRPVSSEIGYTMKCIQHDAAINPGNSGGALVNVYGQVIGINSQKIAATEFEGMGFAIPITSAKPIIDNLTKVGYVPNRPKLGITYYPVSSSTQYSMIAQIQGLPAGALIIDEIDDESSLANTEARRYDMIIAVDGKKLTTADVLLERIDQGKVGDTMTLTLCRVNSNYTVTKFDITITLVEDKNDSNAPTEPDYVDPFEYDSFGY